MSIEIIFEYHGTRLAVYHLLTGVPLEDAAADQFPWQPEPPSWRHVLGTAPCR
jgi:hypothetical protein